LAAVLEGGYDLGALEESVGGVLDELGGENLRAGPAASDAGDFTPGGGAETAFGAVTRAQKRFWKL